MSLDVLKTHIQLDMSQEVKELQEAALKVQKHTEISSTLCFSSEADLVLCDFLFEEMKYKVKENLQRCTETFLGVL